MKKAPVRNFATFLTDIPDPGVGTRDEMNFIEYPGRNVVLAIADILDGLGCRIYGLTHLDERGWEFQGQIGDEAIYCRMQLGEVVYLTLEDALRLTWRLKRAPPCPALAHLLQRFDAALKADGRFHDILWYTPKGYDQDELGAPTPVDKS